MSKNLYKEKIKALEKELKQSFSNEGLLAGLCNATNKWLIDNQKCISVPVDSPEAVQLADLLNCYNVVLENYSFDAPQVPAPAAEE